MSRIRKLSRENDRSLDRYDQILGGTSVPTQPSEPKIGTGRRPLKEKIKYPLFIVPSVATIAFFGDDIARLIHTEPSYEEWSISGKPNGKPIIPDRKVAEKDPTPPSLSLQVDDERSLPVCKGLVFIDKTNKVKIHDPVVDVLPSTGEVFPRRVSATPNNGSIEIGPASKPTDYEWILGTGAVKMTVPFKDCAEHEVRASQFANGPKENDTLRLHEDGYEAYPNQPVPKKNGMREGLVHYTEPYRP